MRSDNDKYIEDLYREYFTRVRSYAERIVRNRQTAEEIAQDVFHIASQSIDGVQRADPPIKWLTFVAKKVSMNYLRRQKRYRARVISIEDIAAAECFATADSEDAMIDSMDNGSDVDAVQAFEARLHKILTEEEFFIYHHLIIRQETHLEIAKKLNITVWACQKRWQRARDKIHNEFYGKK